MESVPSLVDGSADKCVTNRHQLYVRIMSGSRQGVRPRTRDWRRVWKNLNQTSDCHLHITPPRIYVCDNYSVSSQTCMCSSGKAIYDADMIRIVLIPLWLS